MDRNLTQRCESRYLNYNFGLIGLWKRLRLKIVFDAAPLAMIIGISDPFAFIAGGLFFQRVIHQDRRILPFYWSDPGLDDPPGLFLRIAFLAQKAGNLLVAISMIDP